MKLIVYYGKSCPKCPAAKKVAKEAAAEKKLEYEERDIEQNMIEALQLQIASTPSIVLDNEVLFRSEAPSKQELLAEIEKRCD
ncbi:MAG: thioredoxin family protein [Candidatus Woesearchaeota archaeon]